jgi:hypothetical protein
MKMALISRVGLGLAASLVLSASSFAANIAPTSYDFTLKGGGNLSKPSNIWPCGWTFKMKSTSSTGGTMSGGVGDTNSNCSWMTVQPSTWNITSATTGVFHGLEFRQQGLIFCATSEDVPFTIMKTGNDVTSFFFNSANLPGTTCYYNANLNTGAALTVTP